MRDIASRAAWLAAAAAGFWVLGIVLVLSFVAAAWGIFVYAPEHVLGAVASLFLAVWVVVGFTPRIRPANKASMPLAETEHPRLHAFVRELALRAGMQRPDALVLFHAANAFAELGRKRFFGRRHSIVGLGLPMLSTLTTSELGAIVAHELGHHVAGDVRLGPWVHGTRRAIARAVDRLEGSSFWLHLPFVAYAELFLKKSSEISRAQEVEADRVAARVAGACAAASALRKTEVLSTAWETYFASEVVPLLDKARVPPLLEGFELYWRAAQTPNTPAFRSLERALARAQASHVDDTHPSLDERIALLGDPPPASDASPSALALLDDVGRAEDHVVRAIMRDPAGNLEPIAWDAIVDAVWLPAWRDAVAEHGDVLRALSPSALPTTLFEGSRELAQATRRGLAIFSPVAERQRIVGLLGAWLAVHLADRGYRLTAPPGYVVTAEGEGASLEPFAMVSALADGTINRQAWRARCESYGLA